MVHLYRLDKEIPILFFPNKVSLNIQRDIELVLLEFIYQILRNIFPCRKLYLLIFPLICSMISLCLVSSVAIVNTPCQTVFHAPCALMSNELFSNCFSKFYRNCISYMHSHLIKINRVLLITKCIVIRKWSQDCSPRNRIALFVQNVRIFHFHIHKIALRLLVRADTNAFSH